MSILKNSPSKVLNGPIVPIESMVVGMVIY